MTQRVALLDFEPAAGALLAGVPFRAPPPGRVMGSHAIADENDVYASDFTRVSVFACVLKTMYMFEEDDGWAAA